MEGPGIPGPAAGGARGAALSAPGARRDGRAPAGRRTGRTLNVYAESSAVLAWLLGESQADQVLNALQEASIVVASDLTLIEVDRALIRATILGEVPEAAAAEKRAALNEEARYWYTMRVEDEIVERARRPFPGEPVRTLDALHLASALVANTRIARLALLSLDRRVRQAARVLGIALVPS
ncbi:hypothetical protein BH18GEM1_BH18GEM1_18460 [soil metagenome]